MYYRRRNRGHARQFYYTTSTVALDVRGANPVPCKIIPSACFVIAHFIIQHNKNFSKKTP